MINWPEAYAYLQACPAGKPREQLLRLVMGKCRVKPVRAKIRLPRGSKVKTPQAIKKDLKKELEALCKAIVFTRDCGSPEAREGNCISCGKWARLQWGHFIKQSKSKWLQYDPRATGGQCAGCNGPGGDGMPLEYAEAIDRRDGPGAAKALRNEAEAHKGWPPNKTNLTKKLEELMQHPLAPKAASAREAEPVSPKLPPTTQEGES